MGHYWTEKIWKTKTALPIVKCGFDYFEITGRFSDDVTWEQLSFLPLFPLQFCNSVNPSMVYSILKKTKAEIQGGKKTATWSYWPERLTLWCPWNTIGLVTPAQIFSKTHPGFTKLQLCDLQTACHLVGLPIGNTIGTSTIVQTPCIFNKTWSNYSRADRNQSNVCFKNQVANFKRFWPQSHP